MRDTAAAKANNLLIRTFSLHLLMPYSFKKPAIKSRPLDQYFGSAISDWQNSTVAKSTDDGSIAIGVATGMIIALLTFFHL
jgi:hypothetical protein